MKDTTLCCRHNLSEDSVSLSSWHMYALSQNGGRLLMPIMQP